MTTSARSVTTSHAGRSAWRRALNIVIVVALIVASVAAQALDLTPLAIVLLLGAIVALAPLFSPALDA